MKLKIQITLNFTPIKPKMQRFTALLEANTANNFIAGAAASGTAFPFHFIESTP
jgi:hypothetical protein